VTLHGNGTIDLVDKHTGQEFDGLNRLEDTEDVGDEYDWSPAHDTRTLVADDLAGTVDLTEDTGLAATLRARFTFELPARLTADRTGRSHETVACPVEVTVRLTAGADTVAVATTFTNHAEDHRLRAWFRTGVRTDTLLSDGQFHVVPRPLDPPAGADWVQPHPGTYPQQDFSALVDAGGRGLAVVAAGLPEVAPRREADGTATLQLTLLRAVGWLSRDDFPTRRHTNAGPTIPTPEAQCPGPHTFRYALAPLGAGLGDLRRRSRRFLDPVPTRQGVVAGAVPGGTLLEVTNPDIAVAAVRVHPDRDTLVVRCWNQAATAQHETLRLGLPVAGAWLVDLLEDRQEELDVTRGTTEVPVTLLPHRIVSVEVAFAGDPASPTGGAP
jgi:alpha-mannosidase